MALSVREMRLILSAQNNASSALRRVARDVGGLSGSQAMRMRGQQLQITQDRLRATRQIAANELSSIESGKRYLAQQKAVLAQQIASGKALTAQSVAATNMDKQLQKQAKNSRDIRGINQDIYENGKQRVQQTEKLKNIMTQNKASLLDQERIQARLNRTLASKRILPHTRREAELALEASTLRTARLTEEQGRLAKQLKNVGNSARFNLRELRQQLKAAQAATLTLVKEQANLQRKMASATAAVEAQSLAMQKLTADEARLAATSAVLRDRIATTTASIALQAEKIAANNRAIRNARWDRVASAGSAIQHTGRLFQYAGLIAAVGLGVAGKAAADFGEQVTRVATQTGPINTGMVTVARNAKILQPLLLKVAENSTSSFEQINEAAYDLFSTFDKLGDSRSGLGTGTKMLKLFSDAAIAGYTDINTVTNGVVATMTAFDDIPKTTKGAKDTLNTLFAAVRFGRISFDEFAKTLGTTAPAARAAGQSLKTMAGTVAFLSKPLGVEKAAVGFARLSEIFGRQKFIDNVGKAGVKITDANGNFLRFDQIIESLNQHFPKLAKSDQVLQNFFKTMSGTTGTIQARRAFVFLVKQMDEYRRVLGKVEKDNTEFDRSLAAMSATPGVRFKQFINQLKVMGIEIGNNVIPVIVQLGGYVTRMINWWKNLDDSTKRLITRFAVFASIATLMGSAILYVSGVAIRLFALFGRGVGLGGALLGSFLAITAAVQALSGNWDGLNGVIETFVSFGTGSAVGWATTLTIASLAALKLRTAMVGVAAASAAGGASGGILPLILRSPGRLASGLRAVTSLGRESAAAARTAGKSFSTLRGLATGAKAAFIFTPGPLKLVAGIAALAAGGMALLSRHYEEARQRAEEFARAQEYLNQTLAAPKKQASLFGQLGLGTRDVLAARLNLQQAQLDIKNLKAEISKAEPSQKAGLMIQYNQALIRRADAMRDLGIANYRANVQIMAFSRSLAGLKRIDDNAAATRKDLTAAHEKYNTVIERASHMSGQQADTLRKVAAERLADTVARLTDKLYKLTTGSEKASRALKGNFVRAVKDIMNLGKLPGISGAKLQKQIIGDMFDFARKRGKALTLPEMKMFIDLALHPKALRNAEGAIARFIRAQNRRRIELEAQVKLKNVEKQFDQITDIETRRAGGSAINIQAQISVPGGEAKKKANSIRKDIAFIFSKTIPQTITVKTANDPHALGRSIGAQISAGLDAYRNQIITVTQRIVRTGSLKVEGASTNPFSPIPNFADAKTVTKQMRPFERKVQEVYKTVWGAVSKLGLFDKGKMPKFLREGKSSFKDAYAYVIDSIVTLPDQISMDLVNAFAARKEKRKVSRAGTWAVQALIHEWVHAFQSPETINTKWKAEGGATAFAVKHFEDVFGLLGIDTKNMPSQTFEYQAYADRVKKQLGDAWIERGQFGSKVGGPPTKKGLNDVKAYMQAVRLGFQSEARPEKIAALTVNLFQGGVIEKRQAAIDSADKITTKKLDALALKIERAKHGLTVAQIAIAKKGGSTKGESEREGIAIKALAAAYKNLKDAKKQQALGKPINITDIIKDARKGAKDMHEFNRAISTLSNKKGVGKDLLDLFREGGIANLDFLRILVSGKTKTKEFNAVIAAMNKQLKESKKSFYESNQSFKEWAAGNKKAAAEFLKDKTSEAAQNLLDKFNDILSSNKANFGNLFEGLDDKIGDAFTQAHDSWKQQSDDLKSQLKDLNQQVIDIETNRAAAVAKAQAEAAAQITQIQQDAAEQIADAYKDMAEQIAEANKQALESAVQEAKSAFGQLFQGDWLTKGGGKTKVDWGIALNIGDLTKDLQSQLDAFNQWQTLLKSVSGKVPKELADQLKQLGPEAVPQLKALNTATDAELADYVKLWQDSQSTINNVAKDAVANSTELQTQIAKIQSDTMKHVAEIQANADKQIADIQKNLAEQIAQINADAQSQLDDVLKQIDDVTKALADLTEPIPLSSEDIINALQAQITKFKEWGGILEELKNKGVPAELIAQLKDLGPQALPYLQLLNTTTATQLGGLASVAGDGSFVGTWFEAQQTIYDTSKTMMETQLQEWYKYGADAAQQLIAGVSSQQEALTSYFKNLFSSLLMGQLPNFNPPATTNSGLDLAKSSSSGGGGNNGTVINNNIQMDVTAHDDESLQSTLERATFRLDRRLSGD